MTTARVFRSNPVVIAGGVAFAFEGHRLSGPQVPDDQDDPPYEEHPAYWRENFTSREAMPGQVLDQISGSVSMSDEGAMSIDRARSLPILRAVIRDEDRARFEALVKDPDRVVDIGALWNAAVTVVQELSGRPTGGSGA